jgi:DNA-binding beta-propeller fold protein YncE
MFVIGRGNTVYEYEMGGGFSIKTVQYSGNSFSVASQDTIPRDVAFSNDGTKMYVIGDTGNSVYQYSLSTAYDVSTASYDSVSFNVANQGETGPSGIAFNSDGTKMYVVGTGEDKVFQYTLSTAFDLSTASYDSVSFSVASQETFPTELAFNSDGTKMYIIGTATDRVYQYSLSTAFDLSTASYSSVSLLVSGQVTTPTGLAFNSAGNKMYVVASGNDLVAQYNLSTAFDLSTASYDSVSFSVFSQDSNPHGISFNNDGTKMFIVGSTNDAVYEYNLGSTLVSTPVVYSSDYAIAVTNSGGQIDSTFWADVNSTTATESVGTGEVYYAYSTDDHVTWKVIDNTDGERSIARNNSGTWEYNSNGTYGSETWASATTNSEVGALKQALSVAANQMTGTQFGAVSDANHLTLANSLDFMIALKNADSTSTSPTSDGVSINYDANALNQGAVLGTDYNWDFPATDKVRLTSLGDYNLKVRII